MPAPLNLFSFPYFVIKTVMKLFAKLYSCARTAAGGVQEARGLEGDRQWREDAPPLDSAISRAASPTRGLKDMIADNLNEKFGQHEDTGTLIDNAVKTIDEKIDELQTDLLRALEKQTKTIEARFAAMPARK